MNTRLASALACATLFAAMAAQTIHAGTERPRDSGVGCARADNRYCKAPQGAAAGDAQAQWPAAARPASSTTPRSL
ncbi:hypothetical protein [Cupriavidus basilensis]|uniref:Uncharacterized protein n=1 Tax=Cupriavidus basilensis TaxID=68895 RepID=A0A643FQ94_9BURK|nr:hypothetical protein [Cupriavidus basilensis]MCP3023080.1 hypothetical protein [Cupriavidus basilensis]QOT79105.1 hypothetical protein F7R26_030515 [Cupriavidus basilensis]